MRKLSFFQWLIVVLAGLTMSSCQKSKTLTPQSTLFQNPPQSRTSVCPSNHNNPYDDRGEDFVIKWAASWDTTAWSVSNMPIHEQHLNQGLNLHLQNFSYVEDSITSLEKELIKEYFGLFHTYTDLQTFVSQTNTLEDSIAQLNIDIRSKEQVLSYISVSKHSFSLVINLIYHDFPAFAANWEEDLVHCIDLKVQEISDGNIVDWVDALWCPPCTFAKILAWCVADLSGAAVIVFDPDGLIDYCY